MESEPLTIWQKFLEIRKAIPAIQSDAYNEFHKFKYPSSANVLIKLREQTDKLNLLLVPRLLNTPKVQKHKTKDGKEQFFTEIDIKYTWINVDPPNEQVKCRWYGQGLDDAEKGLGKALTYAEKFFLLKFFNIATSDMDPDKFKTAGETKPQGSFDFLTSVKDLKARVNEKEYYKLISKFEVEHSNKIPENKRDNFLKLLTKIKDRNERFITILMEFKRELGDEPFGGFLLTYEVPNNTLMDNKGYPTVTDLEIQKAMWEQIQEHVSVSA